MRSTKNKRCKAICAILKSTWKKTLIHKYEVIAFLFLLTAFIFLRSYQLETRMSFSFDQVNGAWAAKDALIDHHWPLTGPVAKQNSGFYMAPIYYYILIPFYFVFNLHPIASGVTAVFISCLTFLTIFLAVKNLFNTPIAFIAAYIDLTSVYIINSDKVEWNAGITVITSMLIFFFLYKVLTGGVKMIIPLFLTLGFSLSGDFTNIFYFLIVLISLPFFPRKKMTLLYLLLGVIIVILMISPVIVYEIMHSKSESGNLLSYLGTYYHGFHLTRFLQLRRDAFIEFVMIFGNDIVSYFDFLLPLVFIFFYYRQYRDKGAIILSSLVVLWFFIPWLVFTAYSGEITNYYFYMTRPVILIILAYLTYRLISLHSYKVIITLLVIIFWGYFSFTNLVSFFQENPGNDFYNAKRIITPEVQARNTGVRHIYSTPEAYLQFYYEDYKHFNMNND